MKDRIEKLIRTFADGDYSKDTTRRFHNWLTDGDFPQEKEEAVRKVWDETAGEETNLSGPFRKVMAGIARSAGSPRRWLSGSAAAAILIIISSSLTYFLTNSYKDSHPELMAECQVKNGSTEKVLLPDGTVAYLNGGTVIFYPESFSGRTRTVYLSGEGSFKVAKDKTKPFIIHSGKMSVKALGTEFNVKAYPDDDLIYATLIEGKIAVICDTLAEYILSPGEQVCYNRLTGQSSRSDAEIRAVSAWQRGEIVLTKATIGEILQTLNRHFGVKFQNVNPPSGDLFNFMFKQGADIEEVLEIMQIVIGDFDYRFSGGVYYLEWKNN